MFAVLPQVAACHHLHLAHALSEHSFFNEASAKLGSTLRRHRELRSVTDLRVGVKSSSVAWTEKQSAGRRPRERNFWALSQYFAGMRAYPRRNEAKSYVPPHAIARDGSSQPARTLEDIEYSTLYWKVLHTITACNLLPAGTTVCCYGRSSLTVQACVYPSTSVQPSLQTAQHS